MPDSPKCALCFEAGILSQTYRMRKGFKCSTCQSMMSLIGLDERELLWKEKPDDWKAMINQRVNLKTTVIRERLEKAIEEHEKLMVVK